MIHIEFIGISGSGKTIFSDKLESHLIKKYDNYFLSKRNARYILNKSTKSLLLRTFFNIIPNIVIEKILFYTFKNLKHIPNIIIEKPLCYILNCSRQKLKGFLKFITNDKKLTYFLLRSNEYRMMDRSSKILVLRRFFNTMAKYQTIKDYPDTEIMIFDELFYQRVINIFVIINKLKININKENVYEYLYLVPKPHLVIVIKSNIEICKNRMYKRGMMPLRIKNKDDDTINIFLEKCNMCINIIIEWMQKNDVPFILIDNDGELEYSFKELVNKLLSNKITCISTKL